MAAAAPGSALAFHEGGVGPCEACHTMHNSFDGRPVDGGLPMYQAGQYLLKGTDQSSVCLNCHQHQGDPGPAVFHVSTAEADMPPGSPPLQLSPGGDFGWLKKSYQWSPSPGTTASSIGERHGHNIVSVDYSYVADSRNLTAPGGTYPSASLHCTSCHDPHGRFRRFADGTIGDTGLPILASGSLATSLDPVQGAFAVGAYRLLGGIGYKPASLAGNFAFANSVPAVVAPPGSNRSEQSTQTRVAYGQGMSEWCANCHPQMFQGGATSGMGNFAGSQPGTHVVGNAAVLSQAVIGNYIAYVKSGTFTNTDVTRAFLSLVPFEEGTSSYEVLKGHAATDDSNLGGPNAYSTVMCLSCHRAHASGFDAMTRYRVSNDSVPSTVPDATGNAMWPDPVSNAAAAQGRSAMETQQSYYGRNASPFAAPTQFDWCNKCHAKN